VRFLKSTFMLDCQDDGGERERERKGSALGWFFMHANTALLWERCR